MLLQDILYGTDLAIAVAVDDDFTVAVDLDTYHNDFATDFVVVLKYTHHAALPNRFELEALNQLSNVCNTLIVRALLVPVYTLLALVLHYHGLSVT